MVARPRPRMAATSGTERRALERQSPLVILLDSVVAMQGMMRMMEVMVLLFAKIMPVTLVPNDHHVWGFFEASLGVPVPMAVREALQKDSDLIAYANDDPKADDEGFEMRIKELMKHMQSPPAHSSGDPPPGSPAEPSKPPHLVANHLGVQSGMLYRHAEIEDKLLKRLTGQVLAVFADRFDITEDSLDSLFSHIQSDEIWDEACPGSEDGLLRSLRAVARESDAPNPDPFLSRAATLLWRELDALAADISQPRAARIAASGSHFEDAELRVDLHNPSRLERIPIALDRGLLHAVKAACAFFAAKYRWTEEGALHFIAIVGGHAIVKTCVVEFDVRSDLSCLSRITLTLDPTLSPEEVRRIYKDARARVLPHHKEVSHSHLLLAHLAFTQTSRPVDPRHPRYEERFWRELFKDWLRKVPDFHKAGVQALPTFPCVAHFRRAAEAAKDRILHPKIKRPAETRYSPKLEVYRRPKGKMTVPR